MTFARFATLAIFFFCIGRASQAQFDTVINVPPDAAPSSIGSDTQLNLSDGGMLPPQFEAGHVNPINNSNIEVNVAGGTVGNGFRASGNSRINISGGVVDGNFFARGESFVDITGGVMDGVFTARSGSQVDFSGGVVGDGFSADSGGAVDVFGGEMRLDGELISGLQNVGDSVAIDLPGNSVLSGILADGTPFAFSPLDGDSIASGTLQLHRAALPAVGPAQIVASTDQTPPGIRDGQTLIVDVEGVVGDHLRAGPGSHVIVDQGRIEKNFEASGDVTIRSGQIANGFDALPGSRVEVHQTGFIGNKAKAYANSVVNLMGGAIAPEFEALGGSTVNIYAGGIGADSKVHGGAVVNILGGNLSSRSIADEGSEVNLSSGWIGDNFDAGSGSTINVSGGIVRVGFEAYESSFVHITGGDVEDGFHALSGSSIQLTGREFLLDGSSIGELVVNTPYVLTDRDITLSGILAGGSSFDFELNTSATVGQDHFHPEANLTLLLLGNPDFDGSNVVDGDDLAIWESAFGVDDGADADVDGDSDGADFLEWQRQFGSAASAQVSIAPVPEPSTALLGLAAATLLTTCRRRGRRRGERDAR